MLVMVSSVVGSNSHRRLDVAEFRGFALADSVAPLVFLNGGDSKAAQMFTLAHELAHVWLGATGVSDTQAGQVPEQRTERWCNRVAAELLMPLAELRAAHHREAPIPEEIQPVVQFAGRECFHGREQSVLRAGFLPGVLGMARPQEPFRCGVQH